LKIILLLSERTTKAYHGFGKSGGSVFRLTVFRMKISGKISYFAIRQTFNGYVEVCINLNTNFSILYITKSIQNDCERTID
jgi:hypothetical protein